MQEDANPNCTTCSGEGEVYGYFVNHKEKVIQFDWQYCLTCFPGSSGYWPSGEWMEIDSFEYDRLKDEGYHDVSGR